MSDYGNLESEHRNPDDPPGRDSKPATRATNAMWGWVVGAVFVVAVVAVLFGSLRQREPAGTSTASNNVTTPAPNRMAPPVPTPSMAPASVPPASSPAPMPNGGPSPAQ